MTYKNEIEIDVARCFRALKNKWKLIILITILFGVIGVALTLEPASDTYSATSSVYSVTAGSASTSIAGTSVMNDYVDVATSYKVCQRAALLLGRDGIDAETVQQSVSVSSTSSKASSSTSASALLADSAIIKFTAQADDPTVSMEMADAMADAFVMEMNNITGTETVQVLDEAYNYDKVSSGVMQAVKKRLLFAAVGFVLACLMIVFFEIFDSKTRTIRECSIREELPVLGVIPAYKK